MHKLQCIMNSTLNYKIIILSLLFTTFVSAQIESNELAKIGRGKITVEEFQNRFDFMPHLNYSSSEIDSVKKEFLYSLVAEKLWALEADELEIDTLETIRLSLRALQKLFVRDELYKQEVESRINISGFEISKGLNRVTRILNTLIITEPDSQKAWKLYDAFHKGASFDSVVISKKMPQTLFEVKFGSFEDDAMEDVLYTLSINEISVPVKYKDNWFLFKLISDKQDLSIDPSKEQAKNIVIKKLRDRKSQRLGQNYLDKLLSGKSITADRRLFDVVSDNLLEILKNRTAKTEKDTVLDVQLFEIDIRKAMSIINQSDLDAVFIDLDSNPITIKDFLYYIIYQKISFDSFNSKRFKQLLNRVVKKFIEDEIIAGEGFKLGLEKRTSVRNDLQTWRNYCLSEILMHKYADSVTVTDEEINKSITNENYATNNWQVNIREIFTDNIEDAEKILNELNDGKDFESLAEIYNQREWTKQSKGDWGYFDSSIGGEIGKIAAGLNIGQIYGPLKVYQGYSIIKLIDKRKKETENQYTADRDSLKFIRVKIALNKMDNRINNQTINLAKKFKVILNDQLLKKIETTEINTFTYRYIGFGGKIAAFPITIPMYLWYRQYEINREIP
jgi:peptidyl-prolyl cis-trans isomerase C